MTTKEIENFKTIEVLREREREREHNFRELSFFKYAQNGQFSRTIKNRETNKKDRLACIRFKEKINLLHDSLSFL